MSYRIMLLIGRSAHDGSFLMPPTVARLGVVNVVTDNKLADLLEEQHDLVIADISKGADVDAALAHLREQRSRVPLVVLSGVADWREVRRLLQAGAVDYLSKGLDQHEMQRRLRAALALSRDCTESELSDEEAS